MEKEELEIMSQLKELPKTGMKSQVRQRMQLTLLNLEMNSAGRKAQRIKKYGVLFAGAAAIFLSIILVSDLTSLHTTTDSTKDAGKSREILQMDPDEKLSYLGEGIQLGMSKSEVESILGSGAEKSEEKWEPFKHWVYVKGTKAEEERSISSKGITSSTSGRNQFILKDGRKVLFLYWDKQERLSDISICYRERDTEDFQTFKMGSGIQGFNMYDGCGFDGYPIVSPDGVVYFLEEIEIEKLNLSTEKAREYMINLTKKDGHPTNIVMGHQTGSDQEVFRYLHTGDKVKIWGGGLMESSPARMMVEKLMILENGQ
ncbi:DUF3221 domain-containing protein [Neobacillus notoginsengisoli]|uniref:DUF3221 domain-containing protein n=1 Tax=Neobacillus notoginsengisoli TaxID=1578198 RepID=A0A417YQV2_9BACI|nr:DUF3221 domain-containing protein [Neobacillus notoginsengisoli]RHW37242.1 DUF3221 domain-containing protein [Neobacillus notoginsengisoli]